MIKMDYDVWQAILANPERYLIYLGAGASVEAGVPTAKMICQQVYDRLRTDRMSEDELQKRLKWSDPSERYTTCIREGFPVVASRLDYFRRGLMGITPSFAHYATALLMRHKYLHRTCLTTNFDKLLENAFFRMDSDCQAIRDDAELRYWDKTAERHFVVKIHGDCDTENILNTPEETTLLSETKKRHIEEALYNRGLVVLGSSGQEKSIHTLFDYLSREIEKKSTNTLSFGLLWGVYLRSPKSDRLEPELVRKQVQERIEISISKEIAKLMEVKSAYNKLFCFFPIWGVGDFLFDTLESIGDLALRENAQYWLDHGLRVRSILQRAGLPEPAIKNHLERLERRAKAKSKKSVQFDWEEDVALEDEQFGQGVRLRAMYGNIADPELLVVSAGSRVVAVVSPEDTMLSAGGGTARSILMAAGAQFMSNELRKFAPVEEGEVVVTSGGNLRANYVLHAAASKISLDGDVTTGEEQVRRCLRRIMEIAFSMGVDELFVPLIGAGTAGMDHRWSFDRILEVLEADYASARPINVNIIIGKEMYLSREKIRELVEAAKA